MLGTVLLVFLCLICGFALVVMSAIGYKPDPAILTPFMTIIAGCMGFGGMMWGFYYGSSKGSADKNAQIATLITQPPPQNGATGLVITPQVTK